MSADAGKAFTIADKLLLAAYRLDRAQGDPLAAEDLVVAAWEAFPRAFGLRGHESSSGAPLYPDSNRVYAELMGSKPLLKRGHLRKVGKKLYSLTSVGRARAVELEGGSRLELGEPGAGGGKATMSREIRSRLERLLNSRAVRRAQDEKLERITFHDACVFWGITAHSPAIALEGAMAEVNEVIETAERALGSGASELRTGADDLNSSTVELLKNVAGYLTDRFSAELSTIRGRTPG